MPKALPGPTTNPETHERVRHDRVDKAGSVTLRHNSRLHHIGVGRTYAGTCVILLVQDLQIRVVNAAPGAPPRTGPRSQPGLPAHRSTQGSRPPTPK
jgi:hypothetical protein